MSRPQGARVALIVARLQRLTAEGKSRADSVRSEQTPKPFPAPSANRLKQGVQPTYPLTRDTDRNASSHATPHAPACSACTLDGRDHRGRRDVRWRQRPWSRGSRAARAPVAERYAPRSWKAGSPRWCASLRMATRSPAPASFSRATTPTSLRSRRAATRSTRAASAVPTSPSGCAGRSSPKKAHRGAARFGWGSRTSSSIAPSWTSRPSVTRRPSARSR